MQMAALFRAALGLEAPWQVQDIKFSAEARQLDLWLEFPKGSRFSCPTCGTADCPVHDTDERTWRHLNFFQHQTLLHARLPRIKCPTDGVKTVEVPWARPGMGFTLLFEALVLVLLLGGMSVSKAAELLGEHDTRLWRILQHHVDAARAATDYGDVHTVGIDETSRARGHNYITVFLDLLQTRVLHVAEGKDAATVAEFAQDLEQHGGRREQVTEVAMDMSGAYVAGVQTNLPAAQITYDQFHLMQLMNHAVDQVRRAEQPGCAVLKQTRYVWLKNAWKLTAKQAGVLQALKGSTLRTARAYRLKVALQDVLAGSVSEDPVAGLEWWYRWAVRCRLGPVVEVARTIRRHWAGVVRWFTSQITTGKLEAINGLIQVAKRKARGFRSFAYLRTMIYLIAGKLQFRLHQLAELTHTK